ncbi:hypothetical protein TcWFU_005387 [Taenia crassiceps]|uniref:Uncharacterized protein n=1 Tax=Taenia crassiceps TaxID=6207 RepID=A0ABR4Q754_9CEST
MEAPLPAVKWTRGQSLLDFGNLFEIEKTKSQLNHRRHPTARTDVPLTALVQLGNAGSQSSNLGIPFPEKIMRHEAKASYNSFFKSE